MSCFGSHTCCCYGRHMKVLLVHEDRPGLVLGCLWAQLLRARCCACITLTFATGACVPQGNTCFTDAARGL